MQRSSQRGLSGPPQKAQHAVPIKSHLQDIIDKSIAEEFKDENYLCADKIVERIESKLGSCPTVEDQRVIFRRIDLLSSLNKEISLLLEVYSSTIPVQTVSDCEEYVTTHLRKWMVAFKKQPGTYETFDDFGIGSFRYNPKVMQLFKYKKKHADSLPNLSVSFIIQTFIDIVSSSNTSAASISTHNRVGRATSETFNLPAGMTGGQVIGKDGSTKNLLCEITGATNIYIPRNTHPLRVTVYGTVEAIEDCKQRIFRIYECGSAALNGPYQERFEARLRFQLRAKFGITSIESLGLLVNAKDMHLKLAEHFQSVKQVYEDAASSFRSVLEKRLNAEWDVWLVRKSVKKNVLEWLSVETRCDAEDIYAHVAAYFDSNDCSSFDVMVAAVLRVMVVQARSLSARNPVLFNHCKQKLATTSVGVTDEEKDDNETNLFAIVISKENFRDFVLEFVRIFPSLYSLLTFGFDRPSILHRSSDAAHFGNVPSNNELMVIDAFKRAVLSLAIPEDVLTSMRKLLEVFRSEISVQFEANKDIKCEVNSQFNDVNTIKKFNDIFWRLVVKVKDKNVSIHSYYGSEENVDKVPIQALSCALLSPADNSVVVFSTDNNEKFQAHLLGLADGSSMILIFQNLSADMQMPLDAQTLEICRVICGAASLPNEIGAKSSHLCFAVKGVVSKEDINKHTEDISSSTKQMHLYIMNKELFRGLAGLHVLYYSMITYLSTIFSYSCPEDFLNASSKLNTVILSEIEAVPAADLSKSADAPLLFSKVFCAVSSVESAILKKLKIPSFDSLNRGSFVSYLTKDSSTDFIGGLISRLFGNDKVLMVSLGGILADSSIVERNSPRDRVSSADVSNVNLEDILNELCNTVGELNAIQQQSSPSMLFNLFVNLRDIERPLLDIYKGSGRINSNGFVDCKSSTFVQFVVSQFDQLPDDIVEQLTALCFHTTTPETARLELQDEKCPDVPIDDSQSSLLVDCVRWFGRNDNQAYAPDPDPESDTCGLSDAVSAAVALLTRVTLKETGSLGDHRAEAYTALLIDHSEEVHQSGVAFRGHLPDGLLVYCPRQTVTAVDQHNTMDASVFDDYSFINRVIAKLKAVPFGVRCSVGVNWKLLTRYLDSSIPVPDIPVLLKAHEEALASSNRKFMIISCDDAIPIPDALATIEEIIIAVQKNDVHLLASWFLLAAVLDDNARMQFINNCVTALRQVFTNQTHEESSAVDTGLVHQLGIDVACALPDYLGSLVLTPWIKHIVTKYSSGIQVETAEDDFCQHIMSLSLNERILTADRISTLLVSSHGGKTFRRIEDFLLRTDLTIIAPFKASTGAERSISTSRSDAISGHMEARVDEKGPAREDSNLEATIVSSIDGTEEDFDENNPQLCKKLISDIFHSSDVQSSFGGSLQQALSLLSKMNSRDVHFVLEVIQNAADSTYPTNVHPTLLIQLDLKKIVVKTNEVGFSRANVKAITAVGMSHKKNIAGYIGHKGIGFKTVFAVTDKPQIHSKGFHFQFDKNKGSLMAPYWIEDTGTSWSCSHDPNYRTSIVLPLKKEALASFPKLKENLYLAFDKNLLLFLGKLSVMILEDFTVGEGKITTFRRVPLTEHWLLCEHEDVSVDFWYVKRKRFNPSAPKSTDDVDGDIAETEIAIAFNFREDSSLETEDGGGDNLAKTNKEEDLLDVAVESSPLRLTVSKDSMPIYSFLPTKTAAFKFIVQADFVLATNRESLVEQDPYNQQLIQQLSILITEIFQEFALYLQFQISGSDSGLNSYPALSQLCEICDRHKLVLSPQAVVALLPRPFSCSIHKEIQIMSQQICYNLRKCHIFLSTGDVLCDAATLVAIPIFPDVIADFLPESILFKLIGKRFPHQSLVLDEDLHAHFDIKYLRATHIVDCLEVIVSEAGPYLEAAERVNVISRLLVVLAILTTEELPNSIHRSSATATTGAPKRSSITQNLGLVPTAVTKKQLQQQVQSAGASSLPNKTRQLPFDLLVRLKKLPIWPLTSGSFASSATSTLFLQSNNDLPKKVSSYMAQYLSQFIFVVDEALFDSADTIARNFGGLVKEFVAVNFKSKVGHFGLHSLSSAMLLSNVLVPALTNRSYSPTVDQACALLACTYICSDKTRSSVDEFLYGGLGLWIPAVSVRESKDKGNKTWTTDSDQVVFVSPVREAAPDESSEDNNNIDREVHLGPELFYSATSRLFSTLMKQIGWKFVHPKLYCLIYDIEFRGDGYDNAKYKSDLFNSIGSKLASDQGAMSLKTFLKKAGVINFFKVYKSSGSASGIGVAPSLSAVLSKLLINSVPVCVRGRQLRNQPALFLFQPHRVQVSSISPGRSVEGDEKLITYTENKSIYDHIKKDLLDLIASEMRDAVPREKPMVEQVVKDLLNRYPCIPVKVYDLLHSITAEKSLLASLDAALIPDNNQSYYWSHFAIVDVPLNPSLKTLFETIGVRRIPSFKTIAFPELVNIFSWMSRQPQVVASVEMMSDTYYRIQSALSDTQQVIEFEAEIRLLRDLFSSDAPVFWFPSSYMVRDGSSTRRERDILMTSGKMYRPSEVVLFGISDINQKFPLLAFPGCPIRVLSNHYGMDIVRFFQREEYCNYCKLVEGFYCYRGLAIREAIRCESTVTLRCSCRATQMERLSVSKTGLLNINLTVLELVSVMKALRKKLDPEGVSKSDEGLLVKESLEDESFWRQFTAEKYQFLLKSCFESVNRALHKCFTQEDGLFPYVPEDVRALKDLWRSEEFWPSTWKDDSPRWFNFKDTSSMVTLVVENSDVFVPFSELLTEYSANIRVLDLTFNSKVEGLPNIQFTPSPTLTADFLSMFEYRYSQFLQQEKHIIDQKCMMKPLPHLSYYPLVLTDLLPNTVRISDIISTRLCHRRDAASTSSIAASFMQQHIVRLYVTLAFLERDYRFAFDSLMGDGQFYSFLRSKITQVDELYEQSTLDLGKALSVIAINEGYIVSSDRPLKFYVDSKSDLSSLKIFLHTSLSKSKKELKNIGINFTTEYFLEPHVRRRLALKPGAFEELIDLLGNMDNVLLENLWDELSGYKYSQLPEDTISMIKRISNPVDESSNGNDTEDVGDAKFDGAELHLEAYLKLQESIQNSKRSAVKKHVASDTPLPASFPANSGGSSTSIVVTPQPAEKGASSNLGERELSTDIFPPLTTESGPFIGAKLNPIQRGEENADFASATRTPNTETSPRGGDHRDAQNKTESLIVNHGDGLLKSDTGTSLPPSVEVSDPSPWPAASGVFPSSSLSVDEQIPTTSHTTVNIIQAVATVGNSSEYLHRDVEVHTSMNSMNQFSTKLPAKGIEMLDINIESALSSYTMEHAAIIEEQSRLLDSSTAANLMHGKIGECIAEKLLQSRFPTCSIEWMNRCAESCKPFDFLISDSSGEVTCFVEVKTRVSPDPVSQWFITRNELLFAAKTHGETCNYSCVFIHLVESNRGGPVVGGEPVSRTKTFTQVSAFWVDDLMAAASSDDGGLQFSVQVLNNNAGRY